jgi:regulator of protease activity HflC (stomatin/prohibitin superfamily)
MNNKLPQEIYSQLLIIAVVSLIGWGTFVPLKRVYNVWAQGKEGQAELARAESNRQIKTLEAKAMEESAKHLAQAEIIRARGVAEANRIIGDSLKGNEAYLRYLWMSNLECKNKEIIYIPTEANMPILEAGRLK